MPVIAGSGIKRRDFEHRYFVHPLNSDKAKSAARFNVEFLMTIQTTGNVARKNT